MARLLVGVSGGIAAYKSVELVRLAIKAGHSVRVVATESSRHFIGHATFEGITGAPVLVSEFDPDPLRGHFPDPGDGEAEDVAERADEGAAERVGAPGGGHLPISHLALAERAEAMIVAPATANTIAKLAGGLADSALTAAFLACTAPRLVAPAMNGRMYEAAATRENLERLRTRGIRVIEPEYGDLASRDEYGLGRLPEPARLLEVVQEQLAAAPDAAPQGAPEGGWRGRRVLVTAGGTREPVDPVRYLGNRSSGRMGMALAAEALARGAEVTLITANVALPAPAGAELVEVETTAELAAACATAATAADLILMAAAPADFTPRQASTDKLARGEGAIALELEPTDDILAGLAAARPPGQRLVGFAAESGGPALQRAREKLTRKGVDLIVLNDVSDPGIGFDSAENEVTLISDQGERQLSRRPKRAVAAAILDHLEPLG